METCKRCGREGLSSFVCITVGQVEDGDEVRALRWVFCPGCSVELQGQHEATERARATTDASIRALVEAMAVPRREWARRRGRDA